MRRNSIAQPVMDAAREPLTPHPLRPHYGIADVLSGRRVGYNEPATPNRASPFGGVPTPPPGVRPKAAMAMDEAQGVVGNWAQSGVYGEGLAFLGYPYLAELSQRPEYRHITGTFAQQMTRKWIKLLSTGDEDKSDKIEALNAAMKRFELRETFHKAIELDGFFGRGMVFIDLGVTDDPEELRSPLLRDAENRLNSAKIKKGSLKGFVPVDPTWTSPSNYNSTDPLRGDFYKPSTWYVMGKQVHSDRLLTFITREMPDLLKAGYNFGGMSMSQMAKPYVDNWLRTRQSVSDLLHSFTVFVLKLNMQGLLQDAQAFADRIGAFLVGRDNKGLMMVDQETEDLTNVSAPLGTLDHLQAQSQEQMASVSQLPLIWLLGITPTGLNATAEPEIRVFYDRIQATQEQVFGPNLTKVLEILQLNEFGSIDPAITFEFVPLWQLDAAGMAAVQKTKADTDAVYMADGVIAPEEVRDRLAADPESPYHGLEGPPPDPPDMLENPDMKDNAEKIGAAGEEGKQTGANASDTEFREEDHPRAGNGQFSLVAGSAEELPRKGQIDLPSGGKIDVGRIRLAVGKKTSATAIRSELRSKAGLSPDDVEHVASRIEAAPEVRQKQNAAKEEQKAAKHQSDPEQIKANRQAEIENYQTQERYRKEASERAKVVSEKILASPGAQLWSKTDREEVELNARIGDAQGAIYEAKFATLAAVEKIATKDMGLKLRHVSASRGRPDSRYFVHTDANGEKTEIRVSNHEIPETETRFNRNSAQGVKWDEIIVGPEQIEWSAEQWKSALSDIINGR
jgi:phage-related protein (TIGR01555 family)